MKNILKRIILILIVLMLLFSINSKILAWSEVVSDGKDFISQADSSEANFNAAALQEVSGYLYNILLAAGVVIAVIVATVLGMQFMLGGAEGQAKVKEMMIPFIVGCIIVFGGFGFWKIAITVGQKIEGTAGTVTTMKTYERDEDGNPICEYCKDKLSVREQRQGKCTNCEKPTGI